MSIPMIDDMDEIFPERSAFDIKKRLETIVFTATNLAVVNEEGFKKITSLYALSKDWEKRIEFARKQANGPDQDRINLRNDKAKELLNPLKQIQMIAKKKSEQYQHLLEDLKRKEQQRVQDISDLLGLDEAPYVAPVENSIRSEEAIVYTRVVRKFRVVDGSKVPSKYLKIDEEAIDRDIKLGVNSIEGVEIYEEKVTQIRSR